MKIDFSKMTPEIYDKILRAREMINSSKKKLKLLLIEIESLQDTEEGKIMKNDVLNLLSEYNKRDEKLKQFEI